MSSVENINTNHPIGLEDFLRNIETLPPCDKQSAELAKTLFQLFSVISP
jgi:hypothetical protein